MLRNTKSRDNITVTASVATNHRDIPERSDIVRLSETFIWQRLHSISMVLCKGPRMHLGFKTQSFIMFVNAYSYIKNSNAPCVLGFPERMHQRSTKVETFNM